MTKYDLFLSYNSLDCDEIERIRTQLGQLPQPLNTFIDRETLTLGKSWFEEIQEALINSRAVAVFYGKNGLGRWQNREMILAMDLQATTNPDDNRTLVIPVLLPGADLEKAPRFLLLNTFLDLRSPDSPKNLQRFADTVLRQDTLPHAAIALDSLPPRDALRNPYRGLDFFREEDAPLFFGRDDIAQKLLDKIKTCSLVALVGNSGTGKSSVVRAGLIPLLRKQHAPDPSWEVIVCIPGVNPFQNLAIALLESWNYEPANVFKECPEIENTLRKTLSLDVGISQTLKSSQNADKLLLVIDQFEELVTLEKQGAEKQKSDFELFVELLLNAIKATNCKVLLTIRGDYYGTVTERHSGLAEVIEKGTVTLKRLEDKQLREIIEEPAKLGGGKFEKGLAERIIDDVEKQPGNLALLEFALTLLWNSKNDSLLTHEAYEKKVGKLEGAISNKADEILKSSDVGNPQLALMALTRLVRVSSNVEDGGDTRQRVPLKEFNPAERACLEPFVKARLLMASGSWHESDDQPPLDAQANSNQGSTLEVAHEALIRHWPTLQDALKDKRELLIWRQTIRPQYEKWQEINKTGSKQEELDALLLQGYPLEQGLKWLKERQHDLTGSESEFLQMSQNKAQKEQTIFRFLKWAGIAVAGLLISVLAIQIWAASHDLSWPFAARAVMIRIACRVPGLKPGWIPQMQEIKPNSFQMGSTPEAIAADKEKVDEVPLHQVTLKKPFRIGVYEVKFSEYEKFVRDKSYQCKGKPPVIEDYPNWRLDKQPAINVSWDDAKCYVEWLSFLTGAHYRLPTEAEWEYAARVNTTSDYYWGQGEAKDYAWFTDNSEAKTHPVGEKKPNDFGLYDMSGNVFEWVEDCWHDNYDKAPNDGSAWQAEAEDKSDCSRRVLRGGSWLNFRDGLRSARRDWGYPDTRHGDTVGFRLAQD